MADQTKKKLRNVTVVYWVLLVYIIAALLWWALSLLHQINDIYELQKSSIAPLQGTEAYARQLHIIEDEHRRNTAKYIGEGATFLLLILVGAVFVYRSVRRQFRLQLQQQNFMMAVTHELKTPIAVSRLNLETLQRHQLEESKKEKLVQIALQETMRLDTLINNILVSSQLEGASYKLSREDINFSGLTAHMAQQFSSRYPDRQLNALIDEEIEMAGDPLLLRLLVSNLLENAQKYSPRNRPIGLILQQTEKAIILQVIDEGAGIAEEERKNIFQKFYRIGNEQTRTAQGTGLGLYLCKKIAEDHQGSITVREHQPQGSKFIVEFPV